MSLELVLGIVITIELAVVGWILTRAFKESASAKTEAEKAVDIAVSAQTQAKVVTATLSQHIASNDKVLRMLEKNQEKRHEEVVDSINNLTLRFDKHLNGKAAITG